MIRRITITTCLLLVLFLTAALANQARKSRCPIERELEMDQCASKLGFLGDHSFRVPKNLTAASGYCAQLKESINCIQNYGRDCLQGFTRQVLMSLLKRGKQQYSSVCADNKAKQYLMDKLACLEGEKIEQLHRCMDASVARFEYIRSQAKPDVRLQGVCCSYQIFSREVDLTLESVCGRPKQLAGSTAEFVHKVVGGTAGEFFQLICDGHRSLEECRASKKTADLLEGLEEVTRRSKAGTVKSKNKSLVPILLEIIDGSGQ